MSTEGSKGKGKSRSGGGGGSGGSGSISGGGSGMSQGRRLRSRNTMPASGPAFSSAETLSSDCAGTDAPTPAAEKVTYEVLFERLHLSDNPGIPTSATLIGLGHELGVLKEVALARHQHANKALRMLQGKMETRRARDLAVQAEEGRRAAEDAERHERIRLKKRKAESDHARPVAIGAHQATAQGPAPGGYFPPNSPPSFPPSFPPGFPPSFPQAPPPPPCHAAVRELADTPYRKKRSPDTKSQSPATDATTAIATTTATATPAAAAAAADSDGEQPQQHPPI